MRHRGESTPTARKNTLHHETAHESLGVAKGEHLTWRGRFASDLKDVSSSSSQSARVELKLASRSPLYPWPISRQALATDLSAFSAATTFGLFLLPGGLPRLFGVAFLIHAGGRPRRFPVPSASRWNARMESSRSWRSVYSSLSSLATSISQA